MDYLMEQLIKDEVILPTEQEINGKECGNE